MVLDIFLLIKKAKISDFSGGTTIAAPAVCRLPCIAKLECK